MGINVVAIVYSTGELKASSPYNGLDYFIDIDELKDTMGIAITNTYSKTQ